MNFIKVLDLQLEKDNGDHAEGKGKIVNGQQVYGNYHLQLISILDQPAFS